MSIGARSKRRKGNGHRTQGASMRHKTPTPDLAKLVDGLLHLLGHGGGLLLEALVGAAPLRALGLGLRVEVRRDAAERHGVRRGGVGLGILLLGELLLLLGLLLLLLGSLVLVGGLAWRRHHLADDGGRVAFVVESGTGSQRLFA